MPEVNVNGVPIQYPETGDIEWGDEATEFAIQTAAAFFKLGLSTGTSVDITSTLDVTGATTLDSTLTVASTTTLNGNTTITGDVITSIVKASGSGGLTIDSNGGTDVALFGAGGGSGTTLYGGLNGTTATFSGVIYADDDTTANTPVISFTGDTNTGIGHSSADTLDFVTGGVSRFRIESTGQIKAVYESSLGTDYNTTLHNGWLCRAWVNFDGTGVVSPASATGIRASGNVSTILDNGTGNYTINFTIPMPDNLYCAVASVGDYASNATDQILSVNKFNVGNLTIRGNAGTSGNASELTNNNLVVFR
jgi:hypothetical protein